MSLRDWFAGMAMSGTLASVTSPPDKEGWTPDAMATWSYVMADALLRKREETASQ